MATYDLIAPTKPAAAVPGIRKISPSDLAVALAKGLDDFRASPTHLVFIYLLYPVAGLLIWRLAFGYELLPLLYPLATGFALLGPFAAIGLYELSRRREMGLDTHWKHALDVLHSPSLPSILALGFLLLVLFIVWIAIANALYINRFGYADPASLQAFARQVLTTPAGHSLILSGNLVGALFAVVAMSISVIAFPLLLDRQVSVAAAMLTSIRVILRNPMTMLLWGIVVATLLAAGFALLMLGLAVVLPVLGHATWHLYRLAVEPDSGPRPPIEVKPHERLYAADFPASLIAWFWDRR